MANNKNMCYWGIYCINWDCTFIHPDGRTNKCNNGKNCNIPYCKMIHPKDRLIPCKFGADCKYINNGCKYNHPPCLEPDSSIDHSGGSIVLQGDWANRQTKECIANTKNSQSVPASTAHPIETISKPISESKDIEINLTIEQKAILMKLLSEIGSKGKRMSITIQDDGNIVNFHCTVANLK